LKPTLSQRLSESLYDLPTDQADPEESKATKQLMVGTMFVGAPILVVWAFIYLYFGEIVPFILFNAYALILVGLLITLRIRRIRRRLFINMYLSTHLAINFLSILSLGGIANSTGIIFFSLLAPFSIITQPTRQFQIWFGVTIGLVVLEVVLQPWLRTSNLVPLSVSTIFWGFNFLNFCGFLYWTLRAIFRQRDQALQDLQAEQRKSESLLLNILPAEIAHVLKNENRLIADHIEHASILFADVVNFTPMSTTMSPTELVSLLNEVFSYFDTLVEQYDLEKIKTIGDCYMVAAGVPRPRPDHALVLARLALDICEFVSQHEFHGHKLTFRIGINSGSVVAGVIGRKKFSYDLWGDTVNTASRMESHSMSGSIQVTEATYHLIKDEFVCEPRGTIQVKGKGEMPVWFVLAKR
jgi:adenylate cyclase